MIRRVSNRMAAEAMFVLMMFGLQGKNAAAAAPDEPPRPNLLVILADDLGYGDLACYGSETLRTPHIDRLAAQGMRLTHCYAAAANCSPARAGLMTGRTPYRAGIHNWIPAFSPMHLRASETTVAGLLSATGYDTCHSGKWHLNGQFNRPDLQPQPDDHGFAHWFATQNNALPNHRDPDNFVRNGQPVGKLEGYAAELVAAEAVRWLRARASSSAPFFLFVCFHEPHEPIATADRFARWYSHDDPSFVAHHGNISQLDAGVGEILASLEELQLAQDTLVFFTSDNGPAITSIHPHGSAGGLREKKGHLYEGGLRVPGILRWPGRITAGLTSDVPVSSVDWLPTACRLAGVSLPAARRFDGVDLSPLWEAGELRRERPLYWQFQAARSAPKVAIRRGPWKLLATLSGDEVAPGGDIREQDQQSIRSAELDAFELYHLVDDPAESRNLRRAEPEVFRRMRAEMEGMYREVRAESPLWPAWEWPRYESQRIEWPAYRNRQ